MKVRRNPAGGIAGCPFDAAQLAEIERKEAAMAAWNAGSHGDVPQDLVWWLPAGGFKPGEPRVVDWARKLESVERVNANHKEHREVMFSSPTFPHDVDDLRRVVRWRLANPAA
jgi:hypothetical protein